MKEAAFLSSSLISAKGMAGPATRAQPPQEILARKSHLSPSTMAKEVRPSSNVIETPSRKPVAQAAPIGKSASEQNVRKLQAENKKLKRDHLGRVRMSLRLSPDEHLTLKLLSAYANESAQHILEEALKEYVIKHGDKILPQTCHCIRDRVFK
ncbi:hypothetical protein GUA87_12390 [Sneathiella sp. P13V-1]|uniref:hypothetical protein n=1 Tax=Sneathiella sp. P13V-1 TaxID=2697366 RepID=UPI00187B3B8B|nr:hypothetical protein [Sneathiella sp. P13V-1]MBE7637645.1 hypothetical protein [Sneathiella sp. P13V-1]